MRRITPRGMKSLNSIHARAVVTGASSGIGLSITRHLLDAGLRVTGLSRSKPTIEHPEFQHLSIDLSNDGQRQACYEQFSDDLPDLWVNNAGFGLMGETFSIDKPDSDAMWKLLYEVPLEALAWFAAEWKKKSTVRVEKACLVQVSSLAVELPIPYMAHYNAAKSALSALTASLLLESDQPINLIDFRPGDFNTPFVDQSGMSVHPAPAAFYKRLQKHHQQAPHPDKAAIQLCRALQGRHCGVLRSGSFFQRMIAPLGPRALSHAGMRRLIRSYYGLK